jgi:hypothetical protein
LESFDGIPVEVKRERVARGEGGCLSEPPSPVGFDPFGELSSFSFCEARYVECPVLIL